MRSGRTWENLAIVKGKSGETWEFPAIIIGGKKVALKQNIVGIKLTET